MAEIYDVQNGHEITVGLQGCSVCDDAINAARQIARDTNQPVHLVDDDGEWIVLPGGRRVAFGDYDG